MLKYFKSNPHSETPRSHSKKSVSSVNHHHAILKPFKKFYKKDLCIQTICFCLTIVWLSVLSANAGKYRPKNNECGHFQAVMVAELEQKFWKSVASDYQEKNFQQKNSCRIIVSISYWAIQSQINICFSFPANLNASLF